MPSHLLLVSIGPVQDFIAQAKRTRDLWFGSQLLSELSREAAQSIRALAGSVLVFPALDVDGEIPPGIANKILALVDADPASIAVGARNAARQHLLDLWQKCSTDRRVMIDPASQGAALEQIATALDVHAAWAPCPDESAYPEARRLVEEALAARKGLHDFTPWKAQRGKVHKSSLDGARETVLAQDRSHPDFALFRIGAREQLDAVGLLKRTGSVPGQFVPVPSIGLAAWVERAKRLCPVQLDRLVQECGATKRTRVRGDAPWVQAFPFDAQIFLHGRVERFYLAELGGQDAVAAAEFERAYVKPVLDAPGLSAPYPSGACLVADGDRMGDAIEALAARGPEAHRGLSKRLGRFAREARKIVEERHRGVLVYAGGDDMLAFVTLPDALACARALSDTFCDVMHDVPSQGPPPTLSVGLGVGHVLDSLADLLALGREAEKTAKREGRDRLAIVVEMRAGARLAWTAPWDDGPVSVLAEDIARLAAGTINMGKLHELAASLRGMPEPEDPPAADAEEWKSILRHEVGRILGRMGLGSGGQPVAPSDVGLVLDGGYGELVATVDRFTARVAVADVFRRARQVAGADA